MADIQEVYGLIGFPLGHSFSKRYFEEKFERAKISGAAFRLFPLQTIEQFPQLVKDEPLLRGLAVTIPYKEKIIPYLNHLDADTTAIGAVNCIRFSHGELYGYNTDQVGFEQSFLPLLQLHHKKALILGSGGASKAVQFVLSRIGMQFTIVSRKPSGGCISYADIDAEIMREHSTIINCTPVGMSPNEDSAPEIPYSLLGPEYLLYDLIYKPAETLFLKNGAKQGCIVKNGFEMLQIQAEENWKIWTGRSDRAERAFQR